MSIELVSGGGVIFAGTPSPQTVWESHNDEVHVVPDGFTITARSPSCEVQGMEDPNRMRFGLQFHPEVNDSEYGSRCSSTSSSSAHNARAEGHQILRFACFASRRMCMLCSRTDALLQASSKLRPITKAPLPRTTTPTI